MTEQQTAAILKFIKSRDNTGLRAFLTANPQLINVRIYALTPLLFATTLNRPEAVKVLLELGCDTQAKIEDGTHYNKTALQLAQVTNCKEIVELLSPPKPAQPAQPTQKPFGAKAVSDVDWRKETQKSIRSGSEENALGLKKTTMAPSGPAVTTPTYIPPAVTPTYTPVATPTPTPAPVTPPLTSTVKEDNEVVNLSFTLPMPGQPQVARFCHSCGVPRAGMFCSNCGTKF
jgi:hypothetical protein